MNERRTTENIMHADMVLVVIGNTMDTTHRSVMDLMSALQNYTAATMNKMDEAQRIKISSRAYRDVRLATDVEVLGMNNPIRLGLMVHAVLCELRDQGYLQMGGKNPFLMAIDLAKETFTGVDEEERASSLAQARALFDRMQKLGYYQGAVWRTIN